MRSCVEARFFAEGAPRPAASLTSGGPCWRDMIQESEQPTHCWAQTDGGGSSVEAEGLGTVYVQSKGLQVRGDIMPSIERRKGGNSRLAMANASCRRKRQERPAGTLLQLGCRRDELGLAPSPAAPAAGGSCRCRCRYILSVPHACSIIRVTGPLYWRVPTFFLDFFLDTTFSACCAAFFVLVISQLLMT